MNVSEVLTAYAEYDLVLLSTRPAKVSEFDYGDSPPHGVQASVLVQRGLAPHVHLGSLRVYCYRTKADGKALPPAVTTSVPGTGDTEVLTVMIAQRHAPALYAKLTTHRGTDLRDQLRDTLIGQPAQTGKAGSEKPKGKGKSKGKAGKPTDPREQERLARATIDVIDLKWHKSRPTHEHLFALIRVDGRQVPQARAAALQHGMVIGRRMDARSKELFPVIFFTEDVPYNAAVAQLQEIQKTCPQAELCWRPGTRA